MHAAHSQVDDTGRAVDDPRIDLPAHLPDSRHEPTPRLEGLHAQPHGLALLVDLRSQPDGLRDATALCAAASLLSHNF